MKKMLSKILKILMAFGILLISIRNKVFGAIESIPIEPAYGVDYVPKNDFTKIFSYIVIPIIWIIGSIVYWKKSKENGKEKIKVLVIVSIIIIIFILIGIAVFKIIG